MKDMIIEELNTWKLVIKRENIRRMKQKYIIKQKHKHSERKKMY